VWEHKHFHEWKNKKSVPIFLLPLHSHYISMVTDSIFLLVSRPTLSPFREEVHLSFYKILNDRVLQIGDSFTFDYVSYQLSPTFLFFGKMVVTDKCRQKEKDFVRLHLIQLDNGQIQTFIHPIPFLPFTKIKGLQLVNNTFVVIGKLNDKLHFRGFHL
jgi:hypothetical protein